MKQSTNHLLNSSTNHLHSLLAMSHVGASTTNLSQASVSQSLVFYDKSKHESDIFDLKKEVIINPISLSHSSKFMSNVPSRIDAPQGNRLREGKSHSSAES